MPVKNLLARIEELRDVMNSCQEKMTGLIQDYQVNVLQTAAVIAAAKITEEKSEIEKKRECLRKQIEKERERGRETVEDVYNSAGETIDALIRDQERELQEAMECSEKQLKVKTAKVKTETREKTVQEIPGGKRKHSALEIESNECEDEFECADCGRRSPNMFMCDQCQVTTYCNELCQARDWDRHQEHCTEAAQID